MAVTDYPAELATIVDGDTQDFVLQFAADLPLLWGITAHLTVPVPWRIRLAGLNTPENGTPEGNAATLWVRQWFIDHPGRYVLTTTTHDRRDNYGRLLAVVTAADGTNLNAELLADKIAKIYRIHRGR
jgi:endonuclease YncB( thermonuclease family)